jgi:hypothetical protein
MPPNASVHATGQTSANAVVIAIVVELDLVGSWVEVAVTVAAPDAGAVAGAVYTPAEEIVPALADQVTAEL